VHSKRPRSRRYPLMAAIEVTDVGAESQFVGLTSDVSVYGCAVNQRGLDISKNFIPQGRTVRVRIIHAGTNFVATGKVAYANPGAEMGINFTQVEPNHQATLEKWIDQLRATTGPCLDDSSHLAPGKRNGIPLKPQ
jgi:PilZ domain-containing protein